MKTIGVFFGSRSAEHDVSIVTAISSIIRPLSLNKAYKVVPIYITRDGRWYSSDRFADISTFTNGGLDALLAKLKPLSLDLGNGLSLVESGIRPKRIQIDIAFPATHGTHGEDGELPALFSLAGIPFVGCDMQSSSLAMDKVLAKQTVSAHGIKVTRSVSFTKNQYETDTQSALKTIAEKTKYPLFVKPPHLGSSIGISRVSSAKELEHAIEVALHYDDTVLIEEAVEHLREVTLPIMGNQEPIPALLESPLTKPEDFFDFDTKYMSGGKKGKSSGGTRGVQGYSEIPAEVSKELYDRAVATGIAAYQALGCSGIARIDMLIDQKSQIIYFNEANPLPGDLYRHNWNQAGVSSVELVEKLIEYALEHYRQQTQRVTSFNTSYLEQFKK